MNRNDKVLIVVLLLVSFLSLGVQKWMQEPGKEVVIFVDSEKYGSYSLNKEQRIVLNFTKKRKNVVVIKDNSAYMEKASCKDLICVQQKRIDKTGETIICLPNKVVLEIIGGKVDDVDMITG